jgi:hypothetical protein
MGSSSSGEFPVISLDNSKLTWIEIFFRKRKSLPYSLIWTIECHFQVWRIWNEHGVNGMVSSFQEEAVSAFSLLWWVYGTGDVLNGMVLSVRWKSNGLALDEMVTCFENKDQPFALSKHSSYGKYFFIGLSLPFLEFSSRTYPAENRSSFSAQV